MIEQYWNEFLALAVIHLLAVIMPGPDFVVTVRQSIRFGRINGIVTALGIGVGLSVHVIYTLLGISALMQGSELLMMIAKFIGAGYLLYLGVQLCCSKSSGSSLKIDNNINGEAGRQTLLRAFSIGFLTNATNPKATLFFLAVMTSVVSITTPINVQIFYGAWMCFVNAFWFTLVSILFSAPAARGWFNKQLLLMERTLGVVLILFAARLAFL